MQNEQLRKRLGTGALLLLGVAVLLLWAHYFCLGRWVLVLLGLLIALICSWEFSRLCTTREGQDLRPAAEKLIYGIVPFFGPALLFVFLALNGICDTVLCSGNVLAAVSSATAAAFLAALFSLVIVGRNSLEDARRIAAEVFPALLLIGFCSCFLLALAASPGGVPFLVWLVIVVCLNDTCAYFAGTAIGGGRLAVELSPAKTYAGSLAGLAGGLAAGMLLSGLLRGGVSPLLFLFTILVVLAAQAGDLGKSYLKRLYGNKDSGALFPGHGGMLDRVDGYLTAAPLVYLWYCLVPG